METGTQLNIDTSCVPVSALLVRGYPGSWPVGSNGTENRNIRPASCRHDRPAPALQRWQVSHLLFGGLIEVFLRQTTQPMAIFIKITNAVIIKMINRRF